MVKIQFDLHELIGDILSKDGLYVDLMSCKEFTVWYLLRQLGIQSFAPVLGTVCFINEENYEDLDRMLIKRSLNSDIVIQNAQRLFQVKRKIYQEEDGSYQDFIKNAIHHNRFVYSLFDNLYNTLAYYQSFDNEKHGHPIVGYDDDKGVYLSILSNYREITYQDLDNMLEDGYRKYKEYDDILYYFEEASTTSLSPEQKESLRGECLLDIDNTLKDWDTEIEFFRKEVAGYYLGKELTRDQKAKMANEKNGFYNLLMIGVHGDFIFKLRLLEQLFHVSFQDIEELYLANRKTASLIANMFRKATVMLKRDEKYFDQTIPKIAKRIELTYITDAKEIRDKFTERLIHLR